ncbi:enhancer of split M1 protein [Eurosta solidaginis]|uniref:enhancer of split M1 protein n=1 Tax=Eurosta solidaginis TaxID=178769 RepID=UPI0035306A2E
MQNNKTFIILTMLLAYCGANTVTELDNNELHIQVLDGEEPCPTICPSLYAPTCGFDGAKYEQFVNLCMMKMKNCQLKRERALNSLFTRTDSDWCNTQLVNNLFDFLEERNINLKKVECLRPCTMIFYPVCISNGEYRGTIANICHLDILNCALNGTELASKVFKILSAGKCEVS